MTNFATRFRELNDDIRNKEKTEGCAIKSGTDDISDTMSKADAAMYLHKRSKKIGRRKENCYD